MIELKLYKEDGTIKTREEFISDVEALYDEATSSVDTEDMARLLKITTCSETQIDTKRAYETFNFLSKNFYIDDEITQETATDFYKFVEYWNDIALEDEDPIVVYINSPGGDLEAAFSIIATMEQSKIPVNTVIIGRAWSAAFLIAISGDHRSSLKYSSFLYHEGSAYYEADAHKYLQFSKYYENILLKNMETCILANTHIDGSTYESHRKDDWWIDTKSALQYGIIDEIKEDAK